MPNQENFPAIFARLKTILQALVPPMVVQTDAPDNYYLHTSPSPKYPQGLFFGAVQIKKNYVSFHLMLLYLFPDLLDGHSEQLKKRMQGKSCFNFTKLDEPLFVELTQLTHESIERYRQQASAL